ncbi:MAG: hypothetical protein ACPGQS_05035 [Bradymonadia bacterium]
MMKRSGLIETFDRLSSREKVLIGGLAIAMVITAVTIMWLVVGKQLNRLDARNTTIEEALDLFRAQQAEFVAKKSKADLEKARLENNTLKLVQLMQREAEAQGISIQKFNKDTRFLTNRHRNLKRNDSGSESKVRDLVEESQKVTLKRISLDQLANFMAELERRPQPIQTTELTISTLSSDRQVLREAIIKVATYRYKEVEVQ